MVTATCALSYLFAEPIAVFDCIEFNRRFRHGDVAADVAFLAMDLDERAYPACPKPSLTPISNPPAITACSAS